MDIDKLTPEIGVCGQIRPQDLPLIASLGYRSVICNRPDGEAFDQPLYESIETAARSAGLSTHYIPVPGTGLQPEQVAALAEAWPEMEKPALLYCRSGARSRTLATVALSL